MNEQSYIDLYKEHAADINAHGASALNQHREEAFKRWQEMGFPTKKNDHYRHCNFEQELSIDYGLNLKQINLASQTQHLFQCDVPGIQSYLRYVINDTYVQTSDEQLPNGIILCSLREASVSHKELVEQNLNLLAARQNDPFATFNSAYAQDGLFVYVPDGVQMDRPIQLVNLMNASIDFMGNSRNLIVIGKNAKCQVLVCDHASGTPHYFSNRVTEVFIGENSSYEHYKLESTSKQMSNVSSLLIHQSANSSFLGNLITLHNGKTRNNVHIDLNGSGCESVLCGMVIGDGHQVVDNSTAIYHNYPNCHSNELFKYILGESSLGIFNGLLKVQPGAQKTEAYQTNRNLLLSDSADIKTRPQLEIYADDVKCSHGATTGQLDESALFYMRQRGISEEEARLLLMSAFVNDVVENIRIDALKDKIHLLVDKRLRGEKAKCQSCSACK